MFIRYSTFVLLFCFVSAGWLHASDPMVLGENVLDAINQANPQFKVLGTQIVPIPEGTIDYYKLEAETDESDIKFLVVQDTYVVGVLQGNENVDEILVDANGDGTLDYASHTLVVPYWVVAQGYEHDGGSKDDFKIALDQAIENFNSVDNPYLSGAHSELQNILLSISGLENVSNRDLFYALFSYYYLGDRYPWEALQAIGYLSEKYYERYQEDHPLFYLHTLESLINLGYRDNARELADSLVQFWPHFVPGRVYQWQLEDDPDRKAELYDALKKSDPDHWIVQQI